MQILDKLYVMVKVKSSFNKYVQMHLLVCNVFRQETLYWKRSLPAVSWLHAAMIIIWQNDIKHLFRMQKMLFQGPSSLKSSCTFHTNNQLSKFKRLYYRNILTYTKYCEQNYCPLPYLSVARYGPDDKTYLMISWSTYYLNRQHSNCPVCLVYQSNISWVGQLSHLCTSSKIGLSGSIVSCFHW